MLRKELCGKKKETQKRRRKRRRKREKEGAYIIIPYRCADILGERPLNGQLIFLPTGNEETWVTHCLGEEVSRE